MGFALAGTELAQPRDMDIRGYLLLTSASMVLHGGCLGIDDSPPTSRRPSGDAPSDRDDTSEPGTGSSVSNQGDEEAAIRLQLEGTYAGEQQWDFSQMVLIGDGSTDGAADAAIALAVDIAGVPSFAQDDAAELLSGLLGEPLVTELDSVLAATPLFSELETALGSVRVRSRLILESAENDAIHGSEYFDELILGAGDDEVVVPLDDAAGIVGADVIVSDIEGVVDRAALSLEVAEHELVARQQSILAIAGVEVLGYDTLEAALESIFDCPAIVVAAVGDELSLSVAGYEIAFSTDELETICDAAAASVVDRILGMFETNVGLSAGGSLRLIVDGEVVTALEGDGYRGRVTLLPVPLEPSMDVSLQMQRQ